MGPEIVGRLWPLTAGVGIVKAWLLVNSRIDRAAAFPSLASTSRRVVTSVRLEGECRNKCWNGHGWHCAFGSRRIGAGIIDTDFTGRIQNRTRVIDAPFVRKE